MSLKHKLYIFLFADVDTPEPDEKSLITYISSLYDVFPNPPSLHPLYDPVKHLFALAQLRYRFLIVFFFVFINRICRKNIANIVSYPVLSISGFVKTWPSCRIATSPTHSLRSRNWLTNPTDSGPKRYLNGNEKSSISSAPSRTLRYAIGGHYCQIGCQNHIV